MTKTTIRGCVGNYIYTVKYTNECQILYIGKCLGVDDNTLILEKSYYFTIPNNDTFKCFCYDNKNDLEVTKKMELYTMSANEYIETFRNFVKYDYFSKYKLPNKIVENKD